MHNLFSDLDGHEKETLFVIGNGFDLFHNLPTKYLHFYHWLKCGGKDSFIAALERLYPSKYGERNLLWYDFERALGEFDINSIFDQNFQGESSTWYPQIDNVVTKNISDIVNLIKDLVKDWSNKIDVFQAKRLLPLSGECKYLTFNYTSTLEDIYNIPKSQICHIHGYCKSKDNIIIGHNTYLDMDKIEDNEDDFWIGKAKAKIADSMCALFKKCDEEIHYRKPDFFKSIKGVNRIVILGHSLSPIDKPYFGQIRHLADEDVHWHISKHSFSDEELIEEFVTTMKISNYNRWIFNF